MGNQKKIVTYKAINNKGMPAVTRDDYMVTHKNRLYIESIILCHFCLVAFLLSLFNLSILLRSKIKTIAELYQKYFFKKQIK